MSVRSILSASAALLCVACAVAEDKPIDDSRLSIGASECRGGCAGQGNAAAGSGGNAGVVSTAGAAGTAPIPTPDAGGPVGERDSGANAGASSDAAFPALDSSAEDAGGDPGEPVLPVCGDETIPERSDWLATSSTYYSNCDDANTQACPAPIALALDGNLMTRFSTGKIQSGDEWIELDFGKLATINQIDLNTSAQGDYPRHWQVRASTSAPVADAPVLIEANGAPGNTSITLPLAVNARYVRISQTLAVNTWWWSVHELTVECN